MYGKRGDFKPFNSFIHLRASQKCTLPIGRNFGVKNKQTMSLVSKGNSDLLRGLKSVGNPLFPTLSS
jgi:hypothetical protein